MNTAVFPAITAEVCSNGIARVADPRSTVHRVLRKRLSLYPYRLQLIQALQPNDRPLRMQFAVDILSRIDDDNNFLNKVAFSDESTFHVCGKVNTHNVRIWGSTNPHMVREVIRDSPKVNVWCCVMVDRIIGPFFFAEQTVNATTYKDMLKLYAIPQLFELQPTVFFQQDGAPPHWALEVRRTLDNTFPARWIGRGGPIAWPPRSPDLTPLYFFLWGFVKDKVYRTRMIDLDDLKARIRAAIASVDIDMLRRVWTELEFRLDVVRATRGHAFCQDTRDVQYGNNVSVEGVGVEGKVGRVSTEFKAKANPFPYNLSALFSPARSVEQNGLNQGGGARKLALQPDNFVECFSDVEERTRKDTSVPTRKLMVFLQFWMYICPNNNCDMWEVFKGFVGGIREQPPVRTPEELWGRVLDARENMTKNLDLFHNLVDSIPRRMRAVVDAGVL
ncbi:hypothetical protein ANN_16020 [Periplaneta americana]|uniref:Transposable element Tc3 transposase n=1 Tax=Periplaneta americana TaxID=6978 RepID=A0ABQ8SHV1_PERAM|nr:hypothetical protein ANN_16020 [Periplaneta americana]